MECLSSELFITGIGPEVCVYMGMALESLLGNAGATLKQ